MPNFFVLLGEMLWISILLYYCIKVEVKEDVDETAWHSSSYEIATHYFMLEQRMMKSASSNTCESPPQDTQFRLGNCYALKSTPSSTCE